MAKKDDLLWKGILEEIFDDFLRFMHADADELYDLEKGIDFLDQELEQLFPPEADEFAPKVVDKLARVYSREGEEQWILAHVEVQGRYHADFPQRMFTYYYRILDKYKRPITAYAIFTDGVKRKRPNSYERIYQGTHLSYRFNSYQLALQDEAALLESDNPFALAALVGRSAYVGHQIRDSDERDRALLQFKLQLMRLLVAKEISSKKIRALMSFLKYYVNFEIEENNVIFDKQIQEITGRSKTMGIVELMVDRATKQGLQQGEEKKSYEVVAKMISSGRFAIGEIADYAQVPVAFVQKVRAELNKKK